MTDTLVAEPPAATPEARARRLPREKRLFPLRLLISVLVVVPISVVAIALITIATVTSRNIAEQLGDEIVASATTRVVSDVTKYLDAAMRVSELYTWRLEDGFLSTTDLASWEQTMFRDLAANPDIASICFTNPQADCTWLLRAHGRLELGLVSGAAVDHALEWAATADGAVDRSRPLRDYHFDATRRA